MKGCTVRSLLSPLNSLELVIGDSDQLQESDRTQPGAELLQLEGDHGYRTCGLGDDGYKSCDRGYDGYRSRR